MHEVPIQPFVEWLFNPPPFKVLDSGHRLHFYFNTPQGVTSCSYTKSSLIDLLYTNLPQRSLNGRTP